MRRFPAAALLLAVSLAPLACMRPPEPVTGPADPASLRQTRQGAVQGFAHPEGGHAWVGIPFAQPPVGELRWRAPRPAEPWQGTREATAYGPACMQIAGPNGGSDGARAGRPTGSEDCLTLNVFAPRFAPDAVPEAGERLPVLVWIHGGGNTVGEAGHYDPSVLASTRDVVVVTVQYRLGVFGWLSHPALRAEGASADDASGNYGTLDLVRALDWVRENAAAFGGDPGRVTVFGESAGGTNVFSLLLSPRAAGKFEHAIVQSGGTRSHSRAEAENFRDDPEPGHESSSREVLVRLLQADGSARDRETAKAALAAKNDAELASYLRGKSAAEVLGVFSESEFGGGMYLAPNLVRDGHVLPRTEPRETLRAGRYNRVPVILGSNRDENKLFLAFTSRHVRRLGALPLGFRDERAYELEAEYPSRMWKATGVDEPAEAMRGVQGPSVYGYRFDWDGVPDRLWIPASRLIGAAHALEIPFVFGRLELYGSDIMFDPEHHERDMALSRAMTSYWTQFAASGDPRRGREGSLPRWEPWSRGDGHKFAIFDTDEGGGIRMGSEPLTQHEVIARVASDERFASTAERCAVWQGFVKWKDMTRAEYASAADGLCAGHPLDD
ncbi:MAG: carboxylesterase family protein [Myxococcota bacterium]|nr:carboxylesterase family protein [Myxococcota bacterium]